VPWKARKEEAAVVHIGIDVHQRDSQICVLQPNGDRTHYRVRTTAAGLRAVLASLVPAQVLLEASGQSEWVAQTVEALGHQVVVADPNYEPMYPNRRRIKTDRRDAEALAEASARGTYRAVHRRTAAARSLQTLLGVRETLVGMRTQAINVVKAALRGEGARLASGAAETFVARVQAADVPLAVAVVVRPLLTLLESVAAQITVVDAQLREELRVTPAAQRLLSVPGVGPVTALAFVATIDTPTRFPRTRAVAAYLGLVPDERSSGTRQRRGAITKRGPRRMRWLLVQAAWALLRSQRASVAGWQAWAAGIAGRRGKRVAVVALARRLAGLLLAMWRDETVFHGTACPAVA
jgi:transposase